MKQSYKLKCSCGAEYIGITIRSSGYRIKEHATKNESAVKQHLNENKEHKIDFDKVEILDRANTNFKLELKEMIHISQQKPIINSQHASKFNSRIKTKIISKK